MRFIARILAAVLFLTLVADVTAAEAATRPSAPRSVKATPLNAAVKVTWRAPSTSGGARIGAYAVQQRNSPTARWVTIKYTTGAARSWTVKPLVNGHRYYFRVRARNRVGWGRASAQVSAVPRTVPSAPRRPAADHYDKALGFYWNAPSSNGGAAIDHYRVEISTDAAVWTGARKVLLPVPTPTSPTMFTGLAPGTAYWLRVRAHNAAGYSEASGAGPYTARAAPGAVTSLTAVAGNGQVALDWDAPAFDPDTPWFTDAASYRVEVSTDDTNWNEATDPTARPTETEFTVAGLTNGQNYYFRVSALSTTPNVGFGPPSTVEAEPTGPAQALAASAPTHEVAEGSSGTFDVVLTADD